MVQMATCGVGKAQNCPNFVCHRECMGCFYHFRKKKTVVTITLVSSVPLALYYFYEQGGNKSGPLIKASSTGETIEIPAAAVDAAIPKLYGHVRLKNTRDCGIKTKERSYMHRTRRQGSVDEADFQDR